MMNKKRSKLIIALSIIMLMASKKLVMAQNESLNPSNEAVENEATASALLENLEKVAAQDVETVDNEDIKEIYEQMESKKTGFIGQVNSIKDKTVKVIDPLDEEKFLTFDKSTVLVSGQSQIGADGADLSKWLEINDWIVVIGVIEDEKFMPRRIIISSTDLTPKEKVVKRGVLKSLTNKEVIIVPTGSETEEKLTVARTTAYENNTGETIKSKEFTEGAEILVTGIKNGETVTANTLILL